MTIAAGFVVRDGVLLCADTLYSDGYTKEYRDKIFQWTGKGAAVGFALAGNAAVAGWAIELCKLGLSRSRRQSFSSAAILDVLRPIISRVQVEHVDSRAFEERDDSRFSLLIGIAARSERPCLFETAGTVIAPIRDFNCHGTGRDVGRYVIGLAYRPTMAIDEVSMLAILALGSAKEIVNGVGGRSQFLAMHAHGVSPIVPHDVNQSEPLALAYQKRAMALFLEIGRGSSDPEAVKRSIDRFGSYGLNLRKEWAGQAAPWVELSRHLSQQPAPATPQP